MGGPLSFSASGLGYLSSSKTTLLENLSERRDSTSSTLSSVYTLSRRSSGISPCYSSRRSSQASQFGANRPSNISSADSYDPISADISRRSSQSSQCGGISGGAGEFGGGGLSNPLSLTPAQHYRLKVKYAAATGGAPPTPLPFMDRMYLKTNSALHGDSQASSSINRDLPSRQYSSYTMQSLMPHEVPSNMPRRASDPVRRVAIESLSQPQMQRYNSMGTLSGGVTIQPRLPLAPDRRHPSQQGLLRSEGLPRYSYGLRPPSISENVTLDTLTGDIPEEDLNLPDFRTDNRDATNQQDLQVNRNLQQQSYYQRRMAIVNTNINQMPTQVLSPGHQHQMCPSLRDTKANLPTNQPVQQNKVSLGLMDAGQQYSKPQVQGNLAVLQHNQNFGSFQNNLSSNQQVIKNLTNTTQKRLKQLNAEPERNCFQQLSNLNEPTSQCRFNEGISPYDKNGNSTYTAINGSLLSPSCKQESVDMETVDMNFADAGFQPVQVKIEDCDGSIMISDQQNCNMTSQHAFQIRKQSHLQPRPPTEPKSVNRRLSGPKAMQQTRNPNNANAEFSRNGVSGLHCSDNTNDNTMYYTGRIQVFESSGNLDHHVSPLVNVPPFESDVMSPGAGDRACRTVDSNAALEPVQIDFDCMLDDVDHSSLMSGALSPGLLQNLSQNSSRMTTPRNSVTLPSVPAGTGNMAIGDMSSLLTALAEENKFLNMMS